MINKLEFPINYEFIQSIGSGSFADVFLGKHKLIGEKVAIKIIHKKIIKHSDSNQSVSDENSNKSDESEELQINHKFKQEITIMEMIKPQPFVVQLFGFIETTNYYHIMIEYEINGNLAQQLMMYKNQLKENKNKKDCARIENENIIDFSDENEIKNLFVQIVRTVIYLHENCRIAHRDLKAENIVLDENMNIKIIDFGLGCKIIPNKNFNNQANSDADKNNGKPTENTVKKQWILDDQSTCGPPNYVPPEMILRNTLFGEEVDTWMLGVLLYFLVYDIFPYHSHDIKNLISKIAYLDYIVPRKRMVVKEYVKTIKSKSRTSVSAHNDSDDNDDNTEFNFLKQDLFATYPKKKKPHKKTKKTKKSSKNHFLMDEINFYGSGSNFMSSSSSDNNDDNSLSDTKDDGQKVLKFKEVEIDVSESCRDLITKMLCKDPNKRIPLRDVLNHRWILEAKEFVNENENRFSNSEKNVNLPLEQELEQKQLQRSLKAAKLTTFFAEKSDSELFEIKNLTTKAVVDSFFKNGEIPFDLAKTEEELRNNVYNENTEILRILLKREERLQFKKLIDNFLEEK